MATGGYTLTLRAGARVERARHADLGAALDALEAALPGLRLHGRRPDADLRYRTIAAEDQVGARAEVRGPGRLRPAVVAGIDVTGDGTLVAWTGRVNRTPVTPAPGEHPMAALRRTLTDAG